LTVAGSGTKSRTTTTDIFAAVEYLKCEGETALRRFARTHRGTAYSEMRFEAMFHRSASANDGDQRDSTESEAAAFGVAVH